LHRYKRTLPDDDNVIEAVLYILWSSLPNSCLLRPTMGLAGDHACLIRVSSITPHKGKLRHLVEVSGRDSWKVANVLATPETRELQPLSSKGYLDVIDTPGCPLYEVLSSTSCFLIKETVQEGFLEWDVIGESVGVVNTLVRKLRKSGAEVALVRTEKLNGSRRLTNRQEQVLRQAYESGFFESPHETSVRQLGRALKCSPSTLTRLLRKAEKKAVADKLGYELAPHLAPRESAGSIPTGLDAVQVLSLRRKLRPRGGISNSVDSNPQWV
jgi:hypothetical protein